MGGARLPALVRPGRALAVLKHDFFATTALVEIEGGARLVLKRSRASVWLARRERAIYRRLAGIDGIPALVPEAARGETTLAHEWVEGETLLALARIPAAERAGRLGPEFFERLEALVRAIHARSVVVLDLSKPDNIVVRPGGRPAIVDFQISLAFPERRGRLLAALFEALAASDLYQVWKHRRRFGFARSAEEERRGRERGALHRLHRRLLRDPWLAFRRRFLPPDW